jgi:hypothetical protein
MFNKTAGIIQGDSAVFQLSVSVPPGWVNFNVVLTGFSGEIFIENFLIVHISIKINSFQRWKIKTILISELKCLIELALSSKKYIFTLSLDAFDIPRLTSNSYYLFAFDKYRGRCLMVSWIIGSISYWDQIYSG